MPPFDDLRPAHAEPEVEAPARHRVEAHGGHREESGRPRARLHDAGTETNAGGARGHEGEGSGRVVSPRLRGPQAVHTEPFGLHHVVARHSPIVVSEPQRDGDAHQAGWEAVSAAAIFLSRPA